MKLNPFVELIIREECSPDVAQRILLRLRNVTLVQEVNAELEAAGGPTPRELLDVVGPEDPIMAEIRQSLREKRASTGWPTREDQLGPGGVFDEAARVVQDEACSTQQRPYSLPSFQDPPSDDQMSPQPTYDQPVGDPTHGGVEDPTFREPAQQPDGDAFRPKPGEDDPLGRSIAPSNSGHPYS